jgi:hypothetical protein
MGQVVINGTLKQKSSYQINDNCFDVLQFLVRLARFERATAWFVARYSIQLSYRRFKA